jgi:hypothetical protein
MKNLDGASIGNITVADVAKSGTPQVLVTHSAGVKNLPTYSLSLASLAQNWQTSAFTAISPLTIESPSLYSGDFNSDGTTEIVVPYTEANGAWSSLGVFSGITGKQRYAITQPAGPGNYYSVYYDPTRGRGTWRMVTDEGHNAGFNHYMNCYNLANGRLAWTSSAQVNTWMVGSVGASPNRRRAKGVGIMVWPNGLRARRRWTLALEQEFRRPSKRCSTVRGKPDRKRPGLAGGWQRHAWF